MGCLVAAGGLWVLDGSGWLRCLIVYEVRVVGFADNWECYIMVYWGV